MRKLISQMFAPFLFFLLTLPFIPNVLKAQDNYNLSADPKAIVSADNARFTILTPRLIRMEWNENS